MKVSGAEIVSDPTQKASRYLTIVSSTIIMVKLYEVPLQDLEILGVQAPPELFDTVGIVLIIFGLWSLTVHWLGDLVAWRLWFDTNKVYTTLSDNINWNALMSKIGASAPVGTSEEDIAHNEAIKVKEYFGECGKKFRIVAWYGWFYVAGQNYVIPMCLGILALILTTSGFTVPPALER